MTTPTQAAAAAGTTAPAPAITTPPIGKLAAGRFLQVATDNIQRSPFNPRSEASFDKAGLQELADTFRLHGILEPLLVRPVVTGKGGAEFELMGGERRWRAAKLAGLDKVPTIVREATDDEAMVVQMIENHQRKDLTPIEEAQFFVDLQKRDPKKWNTVTIGAAIGRSDRFVSQRMALVTRLDDRARKQLEKGDLSVEKARILAVAPASVQKDLLSNPWNLKHQNPQQLRESILEKLVPESSAAFDVALYKGGWHEEGKTRYFTDVEQFQKLQHKAADDRLKALRAEFPKAQIVKAHDRHDWRWADTGEYVGINDNREKATGKYKVADGKVTAIVWIDNLSRVKSAAGVARGEAFDRSSGNTGSGSGTTTEPAERRRRRLAFLGELRAKVNGDVDIGLRVALAMLIVDTARIGYLRQGADLQGLPEALKKIAESNRWSDGRDIKALDAVFKLDMKTVTRLIAAHAGQAIDWAWNNKKPGGITARLADLLKVKLAPPEEKPAKKKAATKTRAKAAPKKPAPKKVVAKAKTRAKAKKHA